MELQDLTKLKLLYYTIRLTRINKKRDIIKSKLELIETAIATGFASEKEFAEYNKRLLESRKSDPVSEKVIERARERHATYSPQPPKTKFDDSLDKKAIKKADKRMEYVRVIKRRPLKKNPQDSRPDSIDDKEL